MGLGLAIAQRSAQLLGSAITVRSQPGLGSVFSVALPVTPEPTDMGAATTGSSGGEPLA
jgi:signal transduction histidine kinase